MAVAKNDMTEQGNRNFPRVSESCPLRYRALDPAHENVVELKSRDQGAMMNNISGGGICFSSNVALESGRMLALEVDLPGFPTSVISMGKVVWCHPSPGGDGFDIGVEFWWVGWKDEDAQKQISAFITDSLDGDGEDTPILREKS